MYLNRLGLRHYLFYMHEKSCFLDAFDFFILQLKIYFQYISKLLENFPRDTNMYTIV